MATMTAETRSRLRAVAAEKKAAGAGRTTLAGYDGGRWACVVDMTVDALGGEPGPEWRAAALRMAQAGVMQVDDRGPAAATPGDYFRCWLYAVKVRHPYRGGAREGAKHNGVCRFLRVRHARAGQVADLVRCLPHRRVQLTRYAGPGRNYLTTEEPVFRAADLLPMLWMLFGWKGDGRDPGQLPEKNPWAADVKKYLEGFTDAYLETHPAVGTRLRLPAGWGIDPRPSLATTRHRLEVRPGGVVEVAGSGRWNLLPVVREGRDRADPDEVFFLRPADRREVVA